MSVRYVNAAPHPHPLPTRGRGGSCPNRHAPALTASRLPPPLWGRVGEGGGPSVHCGANP